MCIFEQYNSVSERFQILASNNFKESVNLEKKKNRNKHNSNNNKPGKEEK